MSLPEKFKRALEPSDSNFKDIEKSDVTPTINIETLNSSKRLKSYSQITKNFTKKECTMMPQNYINGKIKPELIDDNSIWEGLPKKEYIILLLQALQELGYNDTFNSLTKETGIPLIPPIVNELETSIFEGNWDTCLNLLTEIIPKEEFYISRFFIIKQIFMEAIYSKKLSEAISILRGPLQDACFDEESKEQLQICCNYIMFDSVDQFEKASGWTFKESRPQLWENIKSILSPKIICPSNRLVTLIHQALKLQEFQCLYHNSPINADNLPTTHQNEEYELMDGTKTNSDKPQPFYPTKKFNGLTSHIISATSENCEKLDANDNDQKPFKRFYRTIHLCVKQPSRTISRPSRTTSRTPLDSTDSSNIQTETTECIHDLHNEIDTQSPDDTTPLEDSTDQDASQSKMDISESNSPNDSTMASTQSNSISDNQNTTKSHSTETVPTVPLEINQPFIQLQSAPKFSLLYDHHCPRGNIPCHKLTTLKTTPAYQAIISPNGQQLAIFTKGNFIIYPCDFPFEPSIIIKCPHFHSNGFGSWSPNNKKIVICTEYYLFLIVSFQSDLDLCIEYYHESRSLAQELSALPTKLKWLSDSTQFFFYHSKSIYIWNQSRGITKFCKCNVPIYDFEISFNDEFCIIISFDSILRVYHIKSLKLIWSLDGVDATSIVTSRISPQFLVNSHANLSQLSLWDTHTRTITQKYLGHKQDLYMLSPSFGGPNEIYVLSGSETGDVFIWHRYRGSLLQSFTAHTCLVKNIYWKNNSPYLFTVGDDGDVFIWSTEKSHKEKFESMKTNVKPPLIFHIEKLPQNSDPPELTA